MDVDEYRTGVSASVVRGAAPTTRREALPATAPFGSSGPVSQTTLPVREGLGVAVGRGRPDRVATLLSPASAWPPAVPSPVEWQPIEFDRVGDGAVEPST